MLNINTEQLKLYRQKTVNYLCKLKKENGMKLVLGFMFVAGMFTVMSVSEKQINSEISKMQEKLSQYETIDTSVNELIFKVNEINSMYMKNTSFAEKKIHGLNLKVDSLVKQLEDSSHINTYENSSDELVNLNHELRLIKSEIENLKKDLIQSDDVGDMELPFTLVSLDYWNGVPRLAVRVQGEISLIGKNQTVMAWTLTQVDMTNKVVELSNEQGQAVRVVV